MHFHRRRFLELCALTAMLPSSMARAADLPLVHIIGSAPVIRPDLGYQFYGIPMGYYEKLGFKGEFLTVAGSGAALQLLLSGAGEISSIGFLELVEAKKKQPNLPVTCYFMQEQVASYQTIVLPDSPIKTLKDFEGKSIGVANLASGAIPMTKAMLKGAGVDLSTVSFLPVGVGPQALAAIKAKKVDAISAFTGQLVAMENLGEEFRYFIPEVPAAGFVMADAFVKKNPELATNVLQGMILNQLVMLMSPEDAVRAYWKMNGKPTGDLNKQMSLGVAFVKKTAGTFQPLSDSSPRGIYTQRDWEKLVELTKGLDLIPTGASLSTYYDGRLIAGANKVDVALARDAIKKFQDQ